MALASRWRQRASLGQRSSLRRNLIATGRSSAVLTPIHTRHIPPSRVSQSSRYLPAITSPARKPSLALVCLAAAGTMALVGALRVPLERLAVTIAEKSWEVLGFSRGGKSDDHASHI